MLTPLMYEALLPDSRTVSRDAARRHAFLAAREERGEVGRPHLGTWLLSLRAWRLHLRARLRLRAGIRTAARPFPQS
jgi:hypothetical protein